MFGLGASELLVIALIALFLFGKEDLPGAIRKVVKGIGDFKRVSHDAQRSWLEVRDDVTRSIMLEEEQKSHTNLPLDDESEREPPLPAPRVRAPEQDVVARGSLSSEDPSLSEEEECAEQEGNTGDHDNNDNEERGSEPQDASSDPKRLQGQG